MTATSPPSPHHLHSLLDDISRALQILLLLANEQRVGLHKDDIAGIRRILDRKTTVMDEIDANRRALADHLNATRDILENTDSGTHVSLLMADWDSRTRDVLYALQAVEQECISCLREQLHDTRRELTTKGKARRLAASYGSTARSPDGNQHTRRRV